MDLQNNQRDRIVHTKSYLLRGVLDGPLEVKRGDYADLRMHLEVIIWAKLKHICIASLVIMSLSFFGEQGMPDIFIMKKLWIKHYLSFYLGSGIVSISVKGMTHKFPQLLFVDLLQENLDKFFLLLPATSFIVYLNSFFLNSLSFLFIDHEKRF